jgi:thioredoxin reductase/ferredoxin
MARAAPLEIRRRLKPFGPQRHPSDARDLERRTDMSNPLTRYAHWLHGRWPAGRVERRPEVEPDGSTRVPGLYVAGDLTGIPLLKFALDSGAQLAARVADDPELPRLREVPAPAGADVIDLAILGGGVSGMAAALEAQRRGLSYAVYEAAQPFATLEDFPRGKPIYTYPSGMRPAGELQVAATVKEDLLVELRAQTERAGIAVRRARVERVTRERGLFSVWVDGKPVAHARRVIVAIGASGNFRKLGAPGEQLDKVHYRLHDPAVHAGQDVLVVGGGDSALEAAIALCAGRARVTLAHRGPEFARPKAENVEQVGALERSGALRVVLGAAVARIDERSVELKSASKDGPGGAQSGARKVASPETLPNDAVYALIGREAPLEFFRRSGVPIRGEWGARTWSACAAFVLFCVFLYNWKAGGWLNAQFHSRGWFPYQMPELVRGLGASAQREGSLLHTLAITLAEPGFYYSLAYCSCVTLFGCARIRRRRTPYVTAQTLSLIAFQLVPLFLLPYLVLPYLGHNGVYDDGFARRAADALFPVSSDGHGREYWRSFGFVLAWPLFLWNVFTGEPLWTWLAISLVQTFVLIPWIVWRWGKGAYCGWICSCGALAETLGDTQRQKMPHGPLWNRLNLVGQVLLGVCLLVFALRVLGWCGVGWAGGIAGALVSNWTGFDYYHLVDIGLAGIVGVGLYFWLSGRVWCRFACPLAALMHVYARFSRFRILADKQKCISCNVCTSVCHQGIDVMAFANKGLPMEDPECVRCSACVQQCPTGVLEFGAIDTRSGAVIARDGLVASAVALRERAAR